VVFFDRTRRGDLLVGSEAINLQDCDYASSPDCGRSGAAQVVIRPYPNLNASQLLETPPSLKL